MTDEWTAPYKELTLGQMGMVDRQVHHGQLIFF